jgi:UDP-glucose 4-epimerase
MHYFVTGGSGFIGSAAVKRLVADGHRVTVIDNNSRGRAERLQGLKDDIEFIQGDARDPVIVTKGSRGADCFLHLAALNGTENFYNHPELVLDIGVRSMLAAVDACRANSIGHLVVASSSEAYQSPPVVPTPEDVPLVVPDVLNPRYSYGGSKILSELIAVNYGRTGFDRVTIFRPHNVYGPDMGWEHVLPQLVLRALQEIDAHPARKRICLRIHGSGAQTRAFVHIDDFVDGLCTVIAKGSHLNVYHIGTREELTVREIAAKILLHFGHEADIVPGDPVLGETLRRCPDISKLSALGYHPTVTFDQGLPSLANWYKAYRHLKPIKG